MSAISNVFAAVIIAVLIISTVLVIQINEGNYFRAMFKSTQISFEQKKVESDLDAVLNITEPETNLSLADIVSSMVYYRKKTFDLGGKVIDAEQTMERVFDGVFGKGNYYFKAKHQLNTVRLFFLIDGSKSMEDDVEKISSVLPAIKNMLNKEGLIVQTKIFIGQKDINCSAFSGYDCMEVNEIALYSDFSELAELLGTERNADAFSLRGDFYEDWATLTLFAAKNVQQKTIQEGTITLLFPISDELSTGSEADYCYTGNFRRKGFNSKTQCMVCSTDNSFDRSKETIDFALKNMAELDYLVLPIMVSGCNIPEEIWQSTGNCGNENCEGCIVEPNNTACYHPEVFNDSNNSLRNQMTYFSKEKNGTERSLVIDLAEGYSEEQLENQLKSVLETFVFFSIEVGTKKPKEERISVKRVLPLRGRTISEMTFWSYLERNHYVLTNVKSAIGEKPIAVINLIKDSNNLYQIFADGSFSFDADGNELSFNWTIDDGNIISTEQSFEKIFSEGEEGMHEFELTVINSSLFEGKAVKQICVGPDSVCGERKRFFLVPAEFNLGDEAFEKYAEMHWKNFSSNISCPEKMEKIIIKPSAFSESGSGCNINQLRQCMETSAQAQAILSNIDRCVHNAGYNLSSKDIVLGITSVDIKARINGSCSSQPAGYTMGLGREKTVVSEHLFVEASTHEIGHTFGLCEEYSFSAWNNQNNPSYNYFGKCQNDYPVECTQFNSELCRPDGTCNYFGSGSLWNGKPMIETSLNCPAPEYDCVSAGDSCGNSECEIRENIGNCPQDCFGIDCYGTTLSNGTHSVMGPAAVDGEIDGINTVRKYEEKGTRHINEIICGGN